jgi:uncharacterized damage-inducible protein DinB
MTTGNSRSIHRFERELEFPAPGVPLAMLLWQLAGVIERLTDNQYTMKPVGIVESSIGGHVRHCLDHVSALLAALGTGEINYDHRARGTPIESDRRAALDEIARLEAQVAELSSAHLHKPIQLSVMMTCGGPSMRVATSVGRELAYVLSHTIHHNALVGTMVKLLGGWLPERFGYAPSTVAHLERLACAR